MAFFLSLSHISATLVFIYQQQKLYRQNKTRQSHEVKFLLYDQQKTSIILYSAAEWWLPEFQPPSPFPPSPHRLLSCSRLKKNGHFALSRYCRMEWWIGSRQEESLIGRCRFFPSHRLSIHIWLIYDLLLHLLRNYTTSLGDVFLPRCVWMAKSTFLHE